MNSLVKDFFEVADIYFEDIALQIGALNQVLIESSRLCRAARERR